MQGWVLGGHMGPVQAVVAVVMGQSEGLGLAAAEDSAGCLPMVPAAEEVDTHHMTKLVTGIAVEMATVAGSIGSVAGRTTGDWSRRSAKWKVEVAGRRVRKTALRRRNLES